MTTFTFNNVTFTENIDKNGKTFYTRSEIIDGLKRTKRTNKVEFDANKTEYDASINKPIENTENKPTEKPTSKKKAIGLTLPIIKTNFIDKKGRTIYEINGKAVYLVERINKKDRTASVYLHERINSTLGEPNGNKNSKYNRRIRANIDEAFRLADEAAQAWVDAELAKAAEQSQA